MADRPTGSRRDAWSRLIAFLDEKPLLARSPAELDALDLLVDRTPRLLNSIRQKEISSRIGPWDVVIAGLARNPSAFGFAVVCSFSKNGYVRAGAVSHLARVGERSLPYLLLRACDWVWPVASIAEHAAKRLIPLATDRTLARCLNVLPVIARYDRLDHSPGTLVLQAISERPNVLESARWSASTEAIEFSIARRLCGSNERWVDVLHAGLAHRHHRVTQGCLRALSELSAEGRLGLLEALEVSRARDARLAAAEIAREYMREDILVRLLDDRIWRVRVNSRFYLEQLGWLGFVDHYRRQFPRPTSVAGFGEVASEAELTELVPFLGHRSARVRSAALRALGQREFREATVTVARGLSDECPSVIRAAVVALRRIGYRLTDGEVEQLYGRITDGKRLNALIGALDFVPRWEALRLALELLNRGVGVRSKVLREVVREFRIRLGRAFVVAT